MTPCIEATGARLNSGYVRMPAVGGKRWLAHRYAYHAAHGPIPPGLVVMHSCDNRPCINPEHLSVGTAKDNVHDMLRKGRDACVGSRHFGAKMDDESVRQVRLCAQLGITHTWLAGIFGVSQSVMSRAIGGRLWKHVH